MVVRLRHSVKTKPEFEERFAQGSEMDRRLNDLTIEELKAELERVKDDNLCDLEQAERRRWPTGTLISAQLSPLQPSYQKSQYDTDRHR